MIGRPTPLVLRGTRREDWRPSPVGNWYELTTRYYSAGLALYLADMLTVHLAVMVCAFPHPLGGYAVVTLDLPPTLRRDYVRPVRPHRRIWQLWRQWKG